MESSSSSSTHRSASSNPSSTSELFICFSSRNNSMKKTSSSSKSTILSPARPQNPPPSLSNSVSRRLRSSGSIKNGQASPMFPTGNKRRGSGFENPEPSSPKVTCIGQVRVKTKKQGKKMRNLSTRPSVDMSFRKMEHNQMQRQSSVNSIHHHQECSSHRNQRWVHLPLTICETLRGFGSEFSCLFPPCKSSCFSGEKDERDGASGSSCVDVFAKWLVAVEDESREIGGGKRRDIELVVEDEDEEEDQGKVVKRRHVFDEIEIKDYDEERGRVSICIPPKNALLLMRCRSDPVKMEALASRFWEPQLPAQDEEQEEALCYAGEEKEKEQANLEKLQVEMEEVFEERRASVSGDRAEESKVEQDEDIKLEVEVQVNQVIGDEHLIVSEQEKILEEDLHASEDEKALEDLQIHEQARDGEQDKALEDLQIHEEAQHDEQDKTIEDLQIHEEAQHGEQEEIEDLQIHEEAHHGEQEEIEDLQIHEEAQHGEQEEIEDLQIHEEAQHDEQEKALEDLQIHEEAQHCELEDNKILIEEVEENEASFVTALEVFPSRETELVVGGEESCNSIDEVSETKHIQCIPLEDCKSDDEVSKPEQTEKEAETALEIQANDSTDDAEAEKHTQQEDQTQTSEAQLQVGEQQEESLVTNNTEEEEEVKSNVEVLERDKEEAEKLQELPDCLLLMMCEPKLSMEVSKETWVCSTDFIRWRPQKKKPHAPPCQNKKSSPGNEEKRTSVDNPFAALPPPHPGTQNQAALQPGRASCCLPAASGVSMARMIEQKLVDAVAYEPFVLTRCKSEPMRTASKLAQGACFWKNRAMEPHRRATYGAAGVGC